MYLDNLVEVSSEGYKLKRPNGEMFNFHSFRGPISHKELFKSNYGPISRQASFNEITFLVANAILGRDKSDLANLLSSRVFVGRTLVSSDKEGFYVSEDADFISDKGDLIPKGPEKERVISSDYRKHPILDYLLDGMTIDSLRIVSGALPSVFMGFDKPEGVYVPAISFSKDSGLIIGLGNPKSKYFCSFGISR